MKILFDTSALIAGFVESHPKHNKVLPWFEKAMHGRIEFTVAAHSLAECYAVLTTLPISPKIMPSVARHLIQENIIEHAKIITLSITDYLATLENLSLLGLSGGIVYDALILKAAQKADVKKMLTLNPRDFERLGATAEFIINL